MSETTPKLTREDRLRCVLALTPPQVKSTLERGRLSVTARHVSRRTGLDPERIQDLVSTPGLLEACRLNPNRLTPAQVAGIPGIPPERVRACLEGRPYFSMAELERATTVPAAVLSQLFELEPLCIPDPLGGRELELEPVAGRYLVPPRAGLEAADPCAGLDFEEPASCPKAPVRLLVASDFEDVQAHELKAAYGGQVYPVLADGQGFERLLVPGSLDVWFRAGVSPDDARRTLEEQGLRLKALRPALGYYQVELAVLPDDLDVTRATLEKVATLSAVDAVLFAEPDQVGLNDLGPERITPIDWNDTAVGPRDWNLASIRTGAAHTVTTGSPEVTVFVIDSGLRLDHPDLDDALRPGWEGLDLNFDMGVPAAELSPAERSIAHGTRVAGVVGGRASSADVGSRGVAPGCWVLPVKISGAPLAQSYGLRAVAIREAVRYLRDGERGVINLSWSTAGEHIGIREALVEAAEKGFAIATSAGNYGYGETQVADKPHYPSSYAFHPGDTEADVAARRKIKGLCSVAAVDSRGVKASYSYYGSRAVTLSAPGGEPGGSGAGVFLASSPENYTYGAGTSYAAPHVAGALALLFSLDADLTAAAAVDILRETAADIDAANPSYAGMLGAGLVDLAAAVARLRPSPSGDTGPVPSTPTSGKVSINAAGADELASLPLIGAWTAGRIVAYREANTPFATIWELTRTGVVDRWTVEQIQELITVEATGDLLPVSPPDAPGPDGTPRATHGLADINTTTAEELAALPQIGEWTARRIVEHREIHGPFATVDDLVASGFMDRWSLDQIRHLIRV